jgi:hypothetical protein
MGNRIELTGSIEKKFSQVEQYLRSFKRRLSPNIITVVPPIPVMNYIPKPVDNELLRFLAPVDGEIVCAALKVDHFEKAPVTVEVGVSSNTYHHRRTFEIKKPLSVLKEVHPLALGDTLVVTVDEPESLVGVWISLLYQVSMEYCVSEKFLIEALEAKAEGIDL